MRLCVWMSDIRSVHVNECRSGDARMHGECGKAVRKHTFQLDTIPRPSQNEVLIVVVTLLFHVWRRSIAHILFAALHCEMKRIWNILRPQIEYVTVPDLSFIGLEDKKVQTAIVLLEKKRKWAYWESGFQFSNPKVFLGINRSWWSRRNGSRFDLRA